jgi:hypothetical protein
MARLAPPITMSIRRFGDRLLRFMRLLVEFTDTP